MQCKKKGMELRLWLIQKYLTKTEDIHQPNKLESLVSANMPCAVELFYLTQTQLINKHCDKKLYS